MSNHEEPADSPYTDPSAAGPLGPSQGQQSGGPAPSSLPPRRPDEPVHVPKSSPGGGAPDGGGLLLAEILNAILWAGVSFIIIYWLCQGFELEERTWVLVAIWLLSGLIVLWPGSDGLVARYLLGLR